MRALKILVIGMGVLIVVGIAVLVWGIFNLDPGARKDVGAQLMQTANGEMAATGSPRDGAPLEVTLGLPGFCTIAEARADGHRLVVRATSRPDVAGIACEKVYVIDLRSGAVVGTVAP